MTDRATPVLPVQRSQRKAQLFELRDRLRQHIRRFNVLLRVEQGSDRPFAQIASHLYQRVNHYCLVFCPTTTLAERLTLALRPLGFRTALTSEVSSAFDNGQVDVVVAVSGAPPIVYPFGPGFVLHSSPPVSLEAYIADLAPVNGGRDITTCLLLSADDERTTNSDVATYCRTWACRHAQLARRWDPTMICPQPREFCCNHCDVCIAEPRAALYGDDVGTVVNLAIEASASLNSHRCRSAIHYSVHAVAVV